MKNSIAYLLLLWGAVLGGFGHSAVAFMPPLVISLVGGFAVGFSLMAFTSVYSGTVWGVKVKSSGLSKVKMLIGTLGLFAGGFGSIYTFLLLFVSLTRLDIVTLAVNGIAYIAAFVAGPFVGKLFLEKTLAKEDTAKALGQFAIFQEIDANLAQATDFVVGFEGVALFSQTNYCYAVYRYEDYQLGELSTPNEVALVGTYFIQNYADQFTFKVDMEVIPGTPGQTVVAVGAGGIAVARVKGTRDQRLFRSYIFKRK